MRGPRRGRAAALAASLTIAVASLIGTAAVGSAGPPVCPPVCDTTTEPPPTSTSTTTTSTTIIETTTTTFVTPTTAPPVATTAQVVQNTTTTVNVPTSHNVLVPGDGTEGAESTTTTTEVPTTISNDGTSDSALLALVVGGLVLLAVAVGILTWRYWVATRPPVTPAVGSDHG